jgi:hypothetical protein
MTHEPPTEPMPGSPDLLLPGPLPGHRETRPKRNTPAIVASLVAVGLAIALAVTWQQATTYADEREEAQAEVDDLDDAAADARSDKRAAESDREDAYSWLFAADAAVTDCQAALSAYSEVLGVVLEYARGVSYTGVAALQEAVTTIEQAATPFTDCMLYTPE